MEVALKPPDKRRVRGEESRKLILKAAINSIATLGLGKLTLDQVAERVGISRGLVVFHFKSKDNLIKEVLSFLGRHYHGGWVTIVEGEAKSDMDRLLQLIDYDIRFACENPEYVSAWHAFWGEAKGNVMYQEQVGQREMGYARDMEVLLGKISDDGEYDQQELSLVTRGLFAMNFGIWVQLHLHPEPDDYDSYRKSIRLFLSRMFPNTEIPD
jgi:AcrR family transcriptional regulator